MQMGARSCVQTLRHVHVPLKVLLPVELQAMAVTTQTVITAPVTTHRMDWSLALALVLRGLVQLEVCNQTTLDVG